MDGGGLERGVESGLGGTDVGYVVMKIGAIGFHWRALLFLGTDGGCHQGQEWEEVGEHLAVLHFGHLGAAVRTP